MTSPLLKVLGWINSSSPINSMNLENVLKIELEESKLWLSREREKSTYERDLTKRIELLSWVHQDLKNPEIQICNILES